MPDISVSLHIDEEGKQSMEGSCSGLCLNGPCLTVKGGHCLTEDGWRLGVVHVHLARGVTDHEVFLESSTVDAGMGTSLSAETELRFLVSPDRHDFFLPASSGLVR